MRGGLNDEEGGDGGVLPPPAPVENPYARDTLNEYVRSVNIPLYNNVAREIKLELFFDAKWMLISEIHFESGNFIIF